MLPPLSPEQSIKPTRFELRMSMLFAALYLSNGIHLPYFPLWLEHHDLTPSQIAVILSAPYLMRIIIGPLVSAYADRANDRVPVLITMAVLATVASAGFLLPPLYWVVLIVSVVLGAAWAPHTPLVDSIALSGARRYGSDYALMRVWGSIAFLVVNVIGGYLIGFYGPDLVPPLIVGGFAMIIVAAMAAPRIGRPRLQAPNPADTLPLAASVLRQPYFLMMVTASALGQASHAFAYSFSSIYWASLGIPDGRIGLLWAFSVACEVVMFFAYKRLFGHLRPATALAIGAAIGAARWVLFPLVWPAGAGIVGFFALQSLHAFSFCVLFVSTQRMFVETVPEARMGAAQGVAFFLAMTLLAALTIISGPLYEAFGGYGYFSMAVVAALACVLAVVARAQSEMRLD
ncbi:MAG: MFS transporter [Mesorhizobium sp.]